MDPGSTVATRGRRVGRTTLVAAGLGLTALAPAAGQEAPLRLSVEEAVERAVRENEQVLVARAEQARTRGLVREVRARSLPDLSLQAGYTRNLQTPVIFFNTEQGVQQIRIGDDNEYAFGLSLRQTLFDPALGAARTAARLSRDATSVAVEAARNQVALETRTRYYRVLLDRELVRVQEQALDQARARLGQVRAMHRAGTGSEFDTLTARVEVENIRPELIDARNQLELDLQRLKRTVGVELERDLVLTDSLAAPDGEPPALEALVEAALEQRDDVRSQSVRVDLQQANLTAERRSDLPSLSLDFSLSRRASSGNLLPPERDFVQSTSAGLSFELPLFDGRASEGRVQQAQASVDRERYELQRLRQQARLDVREAHQNLLSARERIRASESNVARAERALEIARVRFRNGLSTQVELSDAELAVTRARTNYAQALFGYHVARARLTAALGER